MIIGIDNGATGTIGLLSDAKAWFFRIPTFSYPNYTKTPSRISRVDTLELALELSTAMPNGVDKILASPIAFMERPMVNFRAKASTVASALRALEAVSIVLEQLNIPYHFLDSKEWQSHFFGSHIMGRDALKKASKEVGISLFPQFTEIISKHGDADGLLIAKYAREVLCTR
ncbi:MAG: hypothetical protein EOM68_12080 [Spirochaetia bacterium]|nr:hypothetical protein [Spirochaetia bacterium]